MKWPKFWSDETDEQAYKAAFPTSEELFGKEEEKPIASLGKDDGHGFVSEVGDWRDDSFWGCYEGR